MAAMTQETAPKASGVAMLGGTLTAEAGVVTGGVDPVIDTALGWQKSTDGVTWDALSDAAILPITSAETGHYLRVRNLKTDSDTPPDELEIFSASYGPVPEPGTAVFFDCTMGSPTQTSYICVETADMLLASMPQSPGVANWIASSDDNAKKRNLNLATQLLDALCWNGEKCNCDQPLEWPRRILDCNCEIASCDEIPFDIQLATAYLAAWLAANNDYAFVPGGGSLEGGGGSGSGDGGGGSIDTGNDQIAGLEPFEEVVIGPIRVKMRANAEFGGEWGWEYLPPFIQAMLWKWLCSNGPGGIGGAGASGFSQGNVRRPSVARTKNRLPYQVPGYMWLKDGMVQPRFGGWASFDDYYRGR